MNRRPGAPDPVRTCRGNRYTQGETGHEMTDWQGPFAGMQGLLEACASVGVIAGLVAAATAWELRRRSTEHSDIG